MSAAEKVLSASTRRLCERCGSPAAPEDDLCGGCRMAVRRGNAPPFPTPPAPAAPTAPGASASPAPSRPSAVEVPKPWPQAEVDGSAAQNAPDAERSLLGAILIDGSLLSRVVEFLVPEDFASEAHRCIYEAALAVAGGREDVDLVTVKNELEKTGRLERAGGAAVLSALVDRVPDVEHVESYARIVRDRARRRASTWALRRGAAAMESGAPLGLVAQEVSAAVLAHAQEEGARRLKAHTAEDLLAMNFPPTRKIVSPIIGEKTLAMLFAPRGAGKTYLGLSLALAAASGGTVFGESGGRPSWRAEEPHGVLYVDGEMPAALLRQRIAELSLGLGCDPAGRLRVIAADLEENGIPSLATREGQRLIEAHVSPGMLLILDNLSTLLRGLEENEADSWEPVQEWLLTLRRQGIAVLLIHHAGRNGLARGTSRREDVLDLVLSLTTPDDFEAEEGARFEVHFTKARGLYGRAAEAFEATLRVDKGRASWTTRDVAEETTERILALSSAGKSMRQIGAELGLDHSTVGRRLRRAQKRAKEAAETRAKGAG